MIPEEFSLASTDEDSWLQTTLPRISEKHGLRPLLYDVEGGRATKRTC